MGFDAMGKTIALIFYGNANVSKALTYCISLFIYYVECIIQYLCLEYCVL